MSPRSGCGSRTGASGRATRWDKIQAVVGRSFRVPGRHENVYTMAANAVLRLILQNEIDPQRVGFLGLGTESSTDNAAGAVIVRGMVDRALDALRHAAPVAPLRGAGVQARLPRRRVRAEGGACATPRYDAGDKLAIVVCGDVAEYERGSTRRADAGRGRRGDARDARGASCSRSTSQHSGSASDYRGPDFRKPFARHFHEAYAPGTKRMSDFPVFSGKYSTYSYLDETVHAVEDMLRKLNVSAGQVLQQRAQPVLPPAVRDDAGAGDELPLRARHGARRSLPGRAARAVRRRRRSRSTTWCARRCRRRTCSRRSRPRAPTVADPYKATSAVAARAAQEARVPRAARAEDEPRRGRRCATSATCTRRRCRCGSRRASRRAPSRGSISTGRPMVAVGYGSGDAAEAIPITPVPGWEQAARRIALKQALGDADRSHAASNTKRCTTAARCRASTTPRSSEFVITPRRRALRAGLPGSRRRVLPVRRLS